MNTLPCPKCGQPTYSMYYRLYPREEKKKGSQSYRSVPYRYCSNCQKAWRMKLVKQKGTI